MIVAVSHKQEWKPEGPTLLSHGVGQYRMQSCLYVAGVRRPTKCYRPIKVPHKIQCLGLFEKENKAHSRWP